MTSSTPTPPVDLDFTARPAGTLPAAVDASGLPVDPATATGTDPQTAAVLATLDLPRGDWTRLPGQAGDASGRQRARRAAVVAVAAGLAAPLLLAVVLMTVFAPTR